MTGKCLNILIVEDNPGDLRLIREILGEACSWDFETVSAGRLSEALAALAAGPFFDVVLLDLGLPDSSGLGSLEKIVAAGPRSSVIVLTGQDDEELGIQAMQRGAGDYLVKGQVNPQLLIRAIRYASERRKTGEELRKTHDYLEKLITYASAPIICWSPDLKITRFNCAFERLTKYTAGEVLGKDLAMLFPEEKGDGAAVKILAGEGKIPGVKSPDGVGLEVPVRLKDGSVRMILWNSANIYEAGGETPVGTIAQGQDITERKLAEELLKRDNETFEKLVRERSRELLDAQQELERAKRLADIGTLASIVAHELRNPLAAISLASSNIKRKAANPLLDGHLRNIDKKIAESNQIINNLLFYSRIKQPQFETVDVAAILGECVKGEEDAAPGKAPAGMELDLAGNNFIEADPLQLKEVFANLLNNARDAVSSVRGGKIRIRAVENCGFLDIRVEDTGAGIAKELLGKIFEPFFTTKAKGTGLGLYVSRQIVNQHGGSITIESEPGSGTVVSVKLPRSAR